MSAVSTVLRGDRQRRAMWFIVLTVVVFLGLWVSPLGTTSVQITVSSSTAGTSQMFFADTLDGFTPLRSSAQSLTQGANTLRFDFNPVNSGFGFYQRWDPCECAGEFTVRELAMRSALFTRVLPLERLQPGSGINSLILSPDGAQVITDPATTNPQVVSSARLGVFYGLNLVVLGGLAVVLAALLTAQRTLIRHYFTTSESWPASTWRKLAAVKRQAARMEVAVTLPARRLRLPTTVTVIAGVVLAVNVVMMFAGAITTGVSTDERTHVSRLQSWLANGWYLPADYVVDGSPSEWVRDTYVYGPVMALLGHAAAVVAGAEGATNVASTAEAYAARHVAVTLVGVIGIAASAGIAKVLFGSWRWGLLAAAVLSAVPMWTGHAMFNIKDTPVATGYTLATLGLVALAQPSALTAARRTWFAIAILSMGIVIAVGTRPGMWTAIVASIAGMLLGSWWVGSGRLGWANASLLTTWRAGAVTAAGIASFAVLLAVYPNAFANPVTLAWQSALSSGKYEMWDGWTITAGVGHGQPPPWWYVPVWLGNQLPILLLIFALIGLAFGAALVVRPLVRRSSTTRSTGLTVGVGLILAQALLMPLLAVAMGSRIYSGIRQLLFIVPAWALLATLGVWWCYRMANSTQRHSKTLTAGVGVLTAASVLLPTFDQLRLFPYNYTYFNEIATLQPVNGRWATDYWQTSHRELAPRIIGTPLSRCLGNNHARQDASSYPTVGSPFRLGWACADHWAIAPYAESLRNAPESSSIPSTQFWLVRENGFGYNVPSNCTIEDAVTRQLRQQTLMMNYLARCELILADYPSDGVVMSPDSGSEFLLDGWLVPAGELGAWSLGEQARVGVTLPENLRGRDLSIVLTGSRLAPPGETRGLGILVNDVVLPVTIGAEDVVMEVPAQIAERFGDGRLFITVRTPDPVVPAEVGLNGETYPMGFLLKSLMISAAGQP